MTRDRLGRGLGALLGDYLEPAAGPNEIQRVVIARGLLRRWAHGT